MASLFDHSIYFIDCDSHFPSMKNIIAMDEAPMTAGLMISSWRLPPPSGHTYVIISQASLLLGHTA